LRRRGGGRGWVNIDVSTTAVGSLSRKGGGNARSRVRRIEFQIAKARRNLKPSLRAKRSNPCSSKGRVDCFVASLLAMTSLQFQTQVRIPAARCARVVPDRSAPKKRAWGMPGAQCTRSLAWEKNNHTSVVTTGPPEQPGIPARNGFNGFLRALPGDRAFLSPSPALLNADLTPASRRQDHTTSPSAAGAVRHQRCPRPPHPAPR
jgi:hypothetical protein